MRDTHVNVAVVLRDSRPCAARTFATVLATVMLAHVIVSGVSPIWLKRMRAAATGSILEDMPLQLECRCRVLRGDLGRFTRKKEEARSSRAVPSTIDEDVANDEVRSAQRVSARTITESASGTCTRTTVYRAVNTCDRSGQASSDAGSIAPRHRLCGEGGEGIH